MASLGPNELKAQCINDQYETSTSVNTLHVITLMIAAKLHYISFLSL